MFFWAIGDRVDPGPGIGGVHRTRRGHRRVAVLGLNLGGHVGDAPEAVERNRDALAASLGNDSRSAALREPGPRDRRHRVEAVGRVDAPGGQDRLCHVEAGPGRARRRASLACFTMRASSGAVHAGRPGLLGGIVSRAVEAMHALGAEQVSAIVGPSVCAAGAEVPENLVRAAAVVAPTSVTTSWASTPAIDVAFWSHRAADQAGVPVERVSGCTRRGRGALLVSSRRGHRSLRGRDHAARGARRVSEGDPARCGRTPVRAGDRARVGP